MLPLLLLAMGLANAEDHPICFEAQPGVPFGLNGTGNCYVAVNSTSLRQTAILEAESREFSGGMGQLAEIDSAEEQAFLAANLGGGPYWLGGTCTGRRCSGGITWDSGAPANFDAFCKKLPRDGDLLVWDNGCWSLVEGTESVGLLIEFPLRPEPTEAACEDRAEVLRCLSMTCYQNAGAPQCTLQGSQHPFGFGDLCVLDPQLAPADCAQWAWHVEECENVPEDVDSIDVDCSENPVAGDTGSNPIDDVGCGCQTDSPASSILAGLALLGLLGRRRS